ncbi:hypothetical protein K435DRAFT_799688 [Dendrothele bispora CBS 962.96]|uniref:DUF6534 domain-containing protein n=1 Tax=Dendrothele bispora (strain CBS 962.96) TaxID=1314807 RepID=A0A4S8LVA4_DENBC|nr:hypothetical protein K435DRAFT_799688 [Dendrothele bispora CBS 962.96]
MSFSMTAERMFGPLLIGVLFNAILFGVLAVQAHLYLNWNRSGERWTRYLVIILLILETLNTGIDFAMVYQALLKNFGQLNLDIPLLAAICDVIIAIVMVFFLTTHKKDSMPGVMKSVVNKIIILIIQTGVLTSVAAVADILTFTLIEESTLLNAREEWSKTLSAQNDAESVSDMSFVHRDGLADSEENSKHQQ